MNDCFELSQALQAFIHRLKADPTLDHWETRIGREVIFTQAELLQGGRFIRAVPSVGDAFPAELLQSPVSEVMLDDLVMPHVRPRGFSDTLLLRKCQPAVEKARAVSASPVPFEDDAGNKRNRDIDGRAAARGGIASDDDDIFFADN